MRSGKGGRGCAYVRAPSSRVAKPDKLLAPSMPTPARRPASVGGFPAPPLQQRLQLLDARMGMVERALRQANEGDEFSERLPGLNTQLLTKKV